MEIEHLIRSTARAVGLKPSAVHCEARLSGLERNDYSKTKQERWCIRLKCTDQHQTAKCTPVCGSAKGREDFGKRDPLIRRRHYYTSHCAGYVC